MVEIVKVKNIFTKGRNYIEFFVKDGDQLKYKKIKQKDYELCKELMKIIEDS